MRSTTLSLLLLLGGASLGGCASAATTTPGADTAPQDPVAASASMTTILADARRDEDRARDVYRHPAETLDFFGVTPDKDVLELSPSGGWYTRILAPFVRADGSLTVGLPDGKYGDTFRELAATDPAFYGHIGVVPFAPPDNLNLGADDSYDIVLTFRNTHGWLRDGVDDAVFTEIFRVLRPGGVLGVVQHRDKRGGEVDAGSGYLPEAAVVTLIEAHGFTLEEASEINANPADTTDHPDGVWSLPPSLRGGEETADEYRAIGESDRMTLRFVKPAR